MKGAGFIFYWVFAAEMNPAPFVVSRDLHAANTGIEQSVDKLEFAFRVHHGRVILQPVAQAHIDYFDRWCP